MRRPTAHTEAGPVEGIPCRDRTVTVFRGVPYAAAPVGDLRWRPPQPPPHREGILRADRFGPMCPQAPTDAAATGVDVPMSEDCLSLNIWTGADSSADLRPVLVWIYGGGFREGTGAHPRYDGENLAGKGLVVVTFNYRLGAFGFLAAPELSEESEHGTSGNYGLLDCVAALRWVRDNITHFGGDPDRVTIAGQSAGSRHGQLPGHVTARGGPLPPGRRTEPRPVRTRPRTPIPVHLLPPSGRRGEGRLPGTCASTGHATSANCARCTGTS